MNYEQSTVRMCTAAVMKAGYWTSRWATRPESMGSTAVLSLVQNVCSRRQERDHKSWVQGKGIVGAKGLQSKRVTASCRSQKLGARKKRCTAMPCLESFGVPLWSTDSCSHRKHACTPAVADPGSVMFAFSRAGQLAMLNASCTDQEFNVLGVGERQPLATSSLEQRVALQQSFLLATSGNVYFVAIISYADDPFSWLLLVCRSWSSMQGRKRFLRLQWKWARRTFNLWRAERTGVMATRARVEHALLASVFTSVPDFVSAKASLQQKGFKLAEEDSLLIAIHPYFWLPDLTALFVTAIPVQVYKANAPIEIEDDEAFSKCEALVDKLLALGDVDSVHTNVVGLD
eukprot:1158787-Pelagomonas_calceolata.AAC.5